MKDYLIKKSKKIGFTSNVVGKSVESKYSKKPFYYLWMCEFQAWMRKEKGIDFVIKPFYDGSLNKAYYVADPINLKTGRSAKILKQETYEKAIELGLITALELID